jgi:hypothetical protein
MHMFQKFSLKYIENSFINMDKLEERRYKLLSSWLFFKIDFSLKDPDIIILYKSRVWRSV